MTSDEKIGAELLKDYKGTQAYENQQKVWPDGGYSQEEYDEHVIEEFLYDYWGKKEEGWKEDLVLPTEAELVADDPSLIDAVIRPKCTELEEEIEAMQKTCVDTLKKASTVDENSQMFTEVYIEKLKVPEIEAKLRRLRQLQRLLPREEQTNTAHDYEENLAQAQAVELASVIEQYLRLEKVSGGYKGLCPFHEEKTASFHAYTDSQRYHCYGCQENGDVINFKAKIDGISVGDAIRELAL